MVPSRPSLSLANLSYSALIGTDLSGADLSDTDPRSVDLHEAVNLTRKQVDSVLSDDQTRLPASLS
ncbi:pentapeptide repeat-containing protein [Streptomyces scopuliridis]|uniref:pentapeptide repeat-containing protein n=1 Tax=Streptomyces scopuliridis TaxID=452529 RepID=UPI0036AEB7D2